MSMFYVISPSPDLGLVRTPPELKDSLKFGSRLKFEPGRVEEVPELRWFAASDKVVDWPFTINGMRLVSDRVKDIFEAHAGPRDEIQWLPATVTTTDERDHPYWVPHFPLWHEVLDEERSTRGPSGIVMRSVLDAAKLEGINAFVIPRTSFEIYVRENLQMALLAAGVTGFDIERPFQV